MDKLRHAVTQDWTLVSVEETLKAYNVSEKGLSPEEAEKRRVAFGLNEIAKGKPTPWYILLGRQFESPLIYILLAAAIITLLMGHYNDVIIIAAVLVINAAIGYYQERKAERAINNIKGMSAPKSRVRRGGEVREVDAVSLVPGDIVLLEEGDKIPADSRIISASRLQVEEAIFTGETIASSKVADVLAEASALADKHNMVFMGTHVTSGRAEIIVTATGMNSELGKIVELVQKAEEILTPLQKKIEEFSQVVMKGVIGICSFIFVSSWLFWGQKFDEVLLNSIALAVSAIPEGLPVIITLVLAIGVRRMAKHKALIRKLPTVETLGSATVVCTDKTGTLTRNEMVVTGIYASGIFYEVTGEGYSCEGKISRKSESPLNEKDLKEDSFLKRFVTSAVLCSNAEVKRENDTWKMIGDPTEGALMALAGKIDSSYHGLRGKMVRKAELPFDSKIKYMVSVNPLDEGNSGELKAHLKGSFEAVLARCSHICDKAGTREMSDADRKMLEDINLSYADKALRVIGFAEKQLKSGTDAAVFVDGEQSGYTFLGVVGMMDMPRPEAIEAVGKCRRAGIKVVMITGDHAATALAIGRKVGIFDEGMKALTGADLAKIDDEELRKIVLDVAIYARTTPEDKMRIVQALQFHGHVVSMTGDGVNDAPALTRADIGVAMGKAGTDVAREAAGMILVDDNFASIVSAVEEGRIIFNNLRKAIGFLVSTNLGEVLVFLISSLIGMAAPLRAVQILWVNLVTDGCTSIALGVEPPEGDEMQKPPRKFDEPLLSNVMRTQIVVVSVMMAIGTLIAYKIGLGLAEGAAGVKVASTMAFCTIVFFQLLNIFNCRSFEKSLFSISFTGNMTLIGSVILAVVLQLGAIYVPFMQNLFGVVGLSFSQFAICLGISLSVIPGVEIAKKLGR
ncbi:MAG: HAD-IC family P-type ATPase [Candidatus Riflebacteria bacterium]|nr:HAD-IC family P-type ATPase [Candidatus Riflebacteria bacterium]